MQGQDRPQGTDLSARTATVGYVDQKIPIFDVISPMKFSMFRLATGTNGT